LIKETIEPGTIINTDESVIDDALPQWGYVKWTPLSRQKPSKFKLRVHVQQKTCCALPW
jgi:hypothetical protein